MRRRALLVLAGAAVVWLVVANNLPAQQGPAADWSRPGNIRSGGVRIYYPRMWNAFVDGTTIVIRSGDTRIMLVDYGALRRVTSLRGPTTSGWTTATAAFFPAWDSKAGP